MIVTIGGITSTAKDNDICDEESESSDSDSDDIPQNITVGTAGGMIDNSSVDAREILTIVSMDTTDNVDDGNVNLFSDPGLQMSVEGVEVDFIMDDEAIDVKSIDSRKR